MRNYLKFIFVAFNPIVMEKGDKSIKNVKRDLDISTKDFYFSRAVLSSYAPRSASMSLEKS